MIWEPFAGDIAATLSGALAALVVALLVVAVLNWRKR